MAETYYRRGLALTTNDLRTHSYILLNLARLYAKLQKYRESNLMVMDILQKIDKTNYRETKIHAYGMLSSNYQKLGDSINYYKSLYHNRNEALNAQHEYSESQYKDLLLKYQSKEKDDLLAEKDAQERKLIYLIIGLFLFLLLVVSSVIFIRRKNQKLNKLLIKNNFLLSELNHRTKNNLQLIVSLTARETNKNDSLEIDGLANLASKIESIASLHKQLYLNDELKSVYLKPYMDDIITGIKPFLQQNEIAINTAVDEVEVNADTALYIGLIINELLINSIKHAFKDIANKQINIVIAHRNKQLAIDYRDNGKGIAQNTKVKLISTLSRQVEADYKLENEQGFHYNAKIKTKR